MPETDIGKSTASNMSGRVEDYAVAARNTEGIGNQDETEWLNVKFSQYFGYYKTIPELKKAIDMLGIWCVGDGLTADPLTTIILDHIFGWGNDTFNSILKNMVITSLIGGDAFAEIIRDEESGELINLKPLDPASIKIIVDRKGMIKRYEQINKMPKKGAVNQRFEPSEIFHITKDRIADEIHGTSIIEACEFIILARNECMADNKKLMHRNVKPMVVFKVDTDDQGKIDEFITKMDQAINKGENIYIPKDTVEFEILSVPPNATLNAPSWIRDLSGYFYQAVGIPAIILGGSQEFTESTAKIAYLAFEQSVKDAQLLIESNVWQQLGLRINLTFPASLRNELLSDEQKDGAMGQMNIQPNEVTAGSGR